MSYSQESALPAHAAQTLQALEAAGQSLADRCKNLRQNTTVVQQEQLEELVLSAISALQSVWNATISPIHRLPPEILVHIFSLVPEWHPVARTDTERVYWPFTFPAIDVNFQLATVCKHWRNVILETPALWSVISETEKSNSHIPNVWAPARCPHGPLSVHVSGWISPRMWSLLQDEGHRIRQLHMTNVIADREAMLALLQHFSAKRLEHCKIDLSIPENRRKPLLSLFSGDGRSLRSLYLVDVSFLPSNRFPRLSRLIIDRYYNREDPHWELGDLINLLVGCPQLEHLHLSRVWIRSSPHQPNFSAGASHAVLPRLQTFTLDLHARLTAATLQVLLSVIELPPTCQLQLQVIPLNELQAISPSLLALGRPLTRMRLALGAAIHDSDGSPRWDWSLVLSSHQPDCAAIRLVFQFVRETEFATHLGPNFSRIPLFENVEELWYRSDLFHEGILRRILLPRRVRSLALSISRWIPSQSAGCLAQVARVGGQLDTLCICVPNAEHLHDVREALTSVGPGGKPRCRAIRRVAVGYERSSTRLSRGAISLRDCGAGTEVSWTGRIAKVGEGDTEMDRLLRAAPQILEEPASIRTGWPTWSGFLW